MAHYLIGNLEQVRDYVARWLWTQDHERHNIAIGMTPKQRLAPAAAEVQTDHGWTTPKP